MIALSRELFFETFNTSIVHSCSQGGKLASWGLFKKELRKYAAGLIVLLGSIIIFLLMRIKVTGKLPNKTNLNLVLPFFIKAKLSAKALVRQLKVNERRLVERYLKEKSFSGKLNEFKWLPRSTKGRLLLIGLGEKAKWNQRRLVLVARQLVSSARTEKLSHIAMGIDDFAVPGLSFERLAQTITENALMADYEFSRYRSQPDKTWHLKQLLILADSSARKEVNKGITIGSIIGEQVNFARDLGNIPGGEMTPKLLADRARETGRACNFKVKVLGVQEMKKLKMGAILGVAKGSAEAPQFIIMEYWGGKRRQAPLVYVGKGVTFDSGGLNLKPEKGMNDMHLDMSGGAAVLAAIGAIARLKLPLNVVGLVPAVENMPGSAGYRPGDLLKSMSGKIIEVLNTDAEGRVILADALAYSAKYKPKVVIDVATLTGACMVALGTQAAGLMTPDVKLQKELELIGEKSGDYVWPLPMWEEYEEEVKGNFGDVANIGKSGYGGAIAGAMFLKQFVGKVLWAHLDIAGPMKSVDGQFLAKGASGVGVRLLIEFARAELAKKIAEV